MIEKGKFVEIRFTNGLYFDAYIEDWSNKESILRLPESDEKVIVINTERDVLLVKILNDKKDPAKKKIHTKNIVEEFEKLKEEPKTDHSLSRMAKLKDELNQLENEEILKQATSHVPSGIRSVTYGIPRNLRVAQPAKHPPQETSTEDSSFDLELQGMFSKEDK